MTSFSYSRSSFLNRFATSASGVSFVIVLTRVSGNFGFGTAAATFAAFPALPSRSTRDATAPALPPIPNGRIAASSAAIRGSNSPLVIAAFRFGPITAPRTAGDFNISGPPIPAAAFGAAFTPAFAASLTSPRPLSLARPGRNTSAIAAAVLPTFLAVSTV